MNKVVIFALLVFAGWKLYDENFSNSSNNWRDYLVQDRTKPGDKIPTIKLSPAKPAPSELAPTKVVLSRFRCDDRQHCSQMKSREEALFFIRNCPNTKMDGDRDGIPCENDSRFWQPQF